MRPGDVLVGGINFGCGSSRNGSAPLKTLGIACVLAESVSRIHLRNAVNTGLPTLVAPGITSFVEEGQRLRVDIVSGEVRNLDTGETMLAQGWATDSSPFQILMAGGLDEFMKRKVREAGGQILGSPRERDLSRGRPLPSGRRGVAPPAPCGSPG